MAEKSAPVPLVGANSARVPGQAIGDKFTYPSLDRNVNAKVVTYGNNEAIYVVDRASNLTLMGDGRIAGSHPGRGKGTLPEPVGGRSAGEHRGHMIPEGGVKNPRSVNNKHNLNSEAAASNLGLKKVIDMKVSKLKDQNPGAEVRFIGVPVRNVGATRPHAVSYYITVNGILLESVSVLNK